MTLSIDLLPESRAVNSQHKLDVAKTRQIFNVRLKRKIELKKQRPNKVPLLFNVKLEKELTQLRDADIIREIGDDAEMGSLFVNPILLMSKNDYVNLVIDARYPASVTDLTIYSWPLESVQMTMTLINGKIFSASALSHAFHQVIFSPEAQKLTSFIIARRQYTYNRRLFWTMWTS